MSSAQAAAKEVKVRVEKITGRVGVQIVSRATRAINEIRNAELDVLKGQRSGRIYKKPGGGTYRASAPGEPPASRTGNLRQNWNGNIKGGSMGGGNVSITLEFVSLAKPYNDYMEHGTPGGMIAPRPFLDKITEKSLPKVTAIYNEPYS